MAGTKGRSGRKTHYDELAIAEVVNLSIKTCREYLQDMTIPIDKRAELAKHFAVKAMPQKIEGSLDLKVQSINYGDIAPA